MSLLGPEVCDAAARAAGKEVALIAVITDLENMDLAKARKIYERTFAAVRRALLELEGLDNGS